MKKNLFITLFVAIATLSINPITTHAVVDKNNVIIGDVNSDGKIDASDATDILQEYSALSVDEHYFNSPTKTFLADLTADNKVDASDATEALNIYADLSSGIERQLNEGSFIADLHTNNGDFITLPCKSYEEAMQIIIDNNPNKHPNIPIPYVATIRKVYVVWTSKNTYQLKNYLVYQEGEGTMTR